MSQNPLRKDTRYEKTTKIRIQKPQKLAEIAQKRNFFNFRIVERTCNNLPTNKHTSPKQQIMTYKKQ